MIHDTRWLLVTLTLLPMGFHTARLKSLRLPIISPPNLAHQSPAVGSVCLATGKGEVEAKVTRLDNGVRNRMKV